jgi:hypothetical protein
MFLTMVVAVSAFASQAEAGCFGSLFQKNRAYSSCCQEVVACESSVPQQVVEERIVKKYEPVIVYRETLVKEKVVKRYEAVAPCETKQYETVAPCEPVRFVKRHGLFKKRRPVTVVYASPSCDPCATYQEVVETKPQTPPSN